MKAFIGIVQLAFYLAITTGIFALIYIGFNAFLNVAGGEPVCQNINC